MLNLLLHFKFLSLKPFKDYNKLIISLLKYYNNIIKLNYILIQFKSMFIVAHFFLK